MAKIAELKTEIQTLSAKLADNTLAIVRSEGAFTDAQNEFNAMVQRYDQLVVDLNADVTPELGIVQDTNAQMQDVTNRMNAIATAAESLAVIARTRPPTA